MGNIGRSSTGCGLCRKRKIKCDEGKPGCKRCALIRKPCPGYPFQVQLQIRTSSEGSPKDASLGSQFVGPSLPPTQPTVTGQKSSSSSPTSSADPGATGKPQSSQIKTENAESDSSLQKLAPAHRSISPPPRYDIQHQSLCFFLNLFCFQAGRLYSFPVLDFLPGMLQNADDHSCIHKAAMAVSRITLADRYSGKDVRLQTGREYGHALSLTNTTIRDNVASIKDETVIAVWLLGLYEQMRLFILNSVRSKDFDDLEIDVYEDEHEFVPSQTANKATAYFHHVARLLEKIKRFLAQDPSRLARSKSTANILLQYGEALDEGMTGWSKDEPGWDMMRVRAEKAGTMWALYPSHALNHFYSFWVFLYWLRFLTARIKLYEALIELLKLDANSTEDTTTSRPASSTSMNLRISKYRTIIQMTASELIGLTAYALGDVTPTGHFHSSVSACNPRKGFQEINVVATMQLVIPLKMLQRSPYPTATQKGAVDLAITHIGDGFRRQPVLFG